MFRTLLICTIILVGAVACANGWPRVHDHPPQVAADCVPTGSKIPRSGCATSTPANRTSADDLDKTQHSVPNSMHSPSGRSPH
jgi:hypothetical protein